jgi:hypothetical protein
MLNSQRYIWLEHAWGSDKENIVVLGGVHNPSWWLNNPVVIVIIVIIIIMIMDAPRPCFSLCSFPYLLTNLWNQW